MTKKNSHKAMPPMPGEPERPPLPTSLADFEPVELPQTGDDEDAEGRSETEQLVDDGVAEAAREQAEEPEEPADAMD